MDRYKQQREERIEFARSLLEQETPSSITPEDVFLHIDEFGTFRKRTGMFLARVSSHSQRSHLECQIFDGLETSKIRGLLIDNVSSYVCRGSNSSFLDDAISKAKSCGASILLAESVDRFVRSPDFGSAKNGQYSPFAEPTEDQLRRLNEKFLQAGILPVTVLPIDISLSDLSSYRSRRGKRTRGRRYERRRKELFLPVARAMRERG